VVPSSAWTHHDRPPSELPRWSTRPLAGATVGVPEAAIMSTPWWVRPPERAAPKLSTNDAAPCTGHTNAAGAGAGGGTAAAVVGGVTVVVVVGGTVVVVVVGGTVVVVVVGSIASMSRGGRDGPTRPREASSDRRGDAGTALPSLPPGRAIRATRSAATSVGRRMSRRMGRGP